MRNRPVTALLAVAVVFSLPVLLFSQAAPQNLTLNLNGVQSQVAVTQMNGHTYVDVTALARATNGTISFLANKTMVLTVPGTGSAAPATEARAATPSFSKEFMRAGIEAMAAIREWRSVLSNGVANSYPVASLGLPNYRAQAAQSVGLATVAANTDADRSAAQLVTNEYENMKKLSDKILAQGQSLSYIEPDAVSSDPLDQQIISCARSLAGMATSGQFSDDGTCH